MELMRPSGAWTRLVSYVSSTLHVLLTVFAGYLVAFLISTRPAIIDLLVFVFAAASKLLALVFTENKNASGKTRVHSTVALAALFPLLLGLTAFEMVTGVLILMLYAVYPLVDGKAPFDITHHMLRYVFIFILGYGSLAFFNKTALLAISAIAVFSVAGELLAGLRKNNGASRNAASFLGIKKSLIVIVFSVFMASLMAAFAFNDLFEFPVQISEAVFPFYIIPALAMGLFLMMPLRKALKDKRLDPFQLMRRKELIFILVASLSILVVFQIERMDTVVAVDSRDYSFDVGIRTFIAGPHDYDVPWIIFDYVNENNYYYVVFHKSGVLELSQVMNGEILNYESSVKTCLSPFQWHNFHVLLNDTTVVVTLDGEYEVSTARHLMSGASSMKISVLHATVFCVCSITVNS